MEVHVPLMGSGRSLEDLQAAKVAPPYTVHKFDGSTDEPMTDNQRAGIIRYSAMLGRTLTVDWTDLDKKGAGFLLMGLRDSIDVMTGRKSYSHADRQQFKRGVK